ncbi:MAG TPA: DUF5715 family protein [Blastocatellia bacterium]|jgi:hypothetical protein|nr:DUF5715 family protein [Blastocatellia bacterium]
MGTRVIIRSFFSRTNLIAFCLSAMALMGGCRGARKETAVQPPPTVEAPQVNPWREAARKVEEDRGEPVGRKAQVETPAELKHYSDRRRFLAVQVAESREQDYDLPHDYAELVQLIRQDQLIEMEPIGKDYILYGVGANASDEPFTHYDGASGENIPLFASDDEFKEESARLADAAKEPQARVTSLEGEARRLSKRDRARRNAIMAELADARKSLTAINDKKKLLDSFYKNPDKRKALQAEYRSLSELASNFGGKTYDMNDPASRRQLKVRLLSHIRPEARDILLEIARSYKEKFDRPLPITSLVRPEQYQKRLGETNANATRIASPPHSTGLAFDVYYFYMTSAEQDYLMSIVAKLKDEGRVEALRENRNHIHIFAFADGHRPDENLIAKEINHVSNGRPGNPVEARAKADKPEPKREKKARAADDKKRPKSPQVARGREKKSKAVAQAPAGRRARGNN